MAAFDFPSSPSVNQTYTANGVTWKWNGTMWMRVSGAGYLEKIEEGNSKIEVDDSGSGNITATVDGTEALRVDSSGRVLLGTTTVGDGSADNLTIADVGHFGMTIRSGTSSVGGIYLGDGTSGSDQYRGFIEYNHSGDYLRLGTNSAERLRITSDGSVAIGGVTPSDKLHVGGNNAFIRVDRPNGNPGLTLIYNSTNSTRADIDVTTGGDLRFATNSSTERLRIDSSGRLLLGLNSSIGGNAIFQVQGSGNKKAQFHQPDSGNCHIQFTNTQTGTSSNNGVEIGLGGDEQAQIWNYYNSYFRIGTNNTERVRITSAGNFGIGTDNPDATLKVNVASGNNGVVVQNTSTGNIALIGARNGDATLQMGQFGSTAGATTFGLSNADLSFIYTTSYGTTHPSALALGTVSNKPLVFATNNTERFRIDSDGDLKSGEITISAYCNTHSITGYSAFLSDNHANTFFGQNLRLGNSGGSGTHQLKVIHQHGSIGGAAMLIGGNVSSNVNELNFSTVAANQPAGTRVDDTNKRMTIRSNGDITIRGTNSQYVECASFEQTAASKNAIVANNGGMVQFNAFNNTNSTIISHSSSTNPSRITFPVAGAVHFSCYQDIITAGSTGYTQVRLYKNGTAIKWALITLTDSQWDTITMNHVVEVAANDYLEVYYTGGTITAMDNAGWCSYDFVFYPINTNRG